MAVDGIMTIWVFLLCIVIVVLSCMLFRRSVRVKKLEKQLSIERELYEINRDRAAADGFYDNVLEADITNDRLLGQNCAALIMLLGLPNGATFSMCIEAILAQFIKEEYKEMYRRNFDRETLLKRYAGGETKFTMEFEEKADLIHYNWTKVTVCIYYSKASQAVKIISYVKNIQIEKEKELHLLKEANTDYLTGLYNKRATELQIRKILSGDAHNHTRHALMLIDVDRFKQVNDTVGHAGGDVVLCKVAALLQENFSPCDVVGRIGGDEFLVLMHNCSDGDAALKKAEQLAQRLAAVDTSSYMGLSLSLSIGIALFPQHADHYTDLCNLADAALYHVKRNGRNGCCLYSTALDKK